jgi:hypothetical protein
LLESAINEERLLAVIIPTQNMKHQRSGKKKEFTSFTKKSVLYQ